MGALNDAGCQRVFTEEISGVKAERPGLERASGNVRAGETLMVWRLDRLGRSNKDLVARIDEFLSRDVGFRSLQEAIDTTSPTGTLVLHLFGALAESERHLTR